MQSRSSPELNKRVHRLRVISAAQNHGFLSGTYTSMDNLHDRIGQTEDSDLIRHMHPADEVPH